MSTRKVVGGTKDAHGIYTPTPKAVEAPPTLATSHPSDPKVSDISLDDLIGKHLLIIYRDTRQLLIESVTGKLSKESSQCLRDNLKLLLELKDREKDIFEDIPEEELRKIISESRS